jgi:hypothetical protein
MRNLKSKSHRNMPVSVPRAHGLWRRMGGLAIVATLSVLVSACAHTGAETPTPQWQFNTAESAPPRAADLSASYTCGGNPSGWSDNCYVYRGGRDPNTGVAYTQM